ncbi:MAG: alpha/beta hydrolase [Ramlibacter sp.]
MSKQDGAWHDAMYNNRALVPDHGRHLARWTARSADATRSHARELDIRYGGGPSEHLDVFSAPADSGAPVLVFIHGGYWRALDKRDHAFIAPAFTQHGVCVVIPNYALRPVLTVTGVAMQTVAALAWTWRNIRRYGGDPDRITVAGHSVGGTHAALLLACLWPVYAPDLPADLVKKVLALSGIYDLEPLRQSPFLQPSVALTPQQVLQASPARLPSPPRGTLFTVVGAEESPEYLRQNRLIQKVWGKQRVPVCEALAGLNHFSIVEALAEPGHQLHVLARQLMGV